MSIFNLTFQTISQLEAILGTSLTETDLLLIQTSTGTKKIEIGQFKASTALAGSIQLSEKGQAYGVATLDSTSKIPDSQIPDAITRDSELTAGLATKVGLTGDETIGGSKTFSNTLNVAGGNGLTTYVGGDVTKPVPIVPYAWTTSTEYGISVPLLKVTNGRFDFEPSSNKAEFRVTGASTQFNLYNSDLSSYYLKINPDLQSYFFNTINVTGGVTASGTGSFNSLSLTNALSVGNGGTGSTTASGARTSLGAAASGANSDITSLNGLTTALSIGQGGTGATSASAARTALGVDPTTAQYNANQIQGKSIATPSTASTIPQYNGSSITWVSAGSVGSATDWANPGTIGSTTPNTGAFTSISLGSSLTIGNGGTGAATASAAKANLGVLGSKYLSKTAAYTITTSDSGSLIDCNAATAAFTLTLPSASSANGALIYTIRKTDSSSNAITIARNGTDLINGATSLSLSVQYQTITIVSNQNGTWTVQSNQNPVIPISQGGTGATTQSAAQVALGLNPLDAQYNANRIQGQTISSTLATNGQALVYDVASSSYIPRTAGKVIQVKFAFQTVQAATTSTTYTDSGLGVTITPLFSTSDILVLVHVNGIYQSGSTWVNLQLKRRQNSGSYSTLNQISSGQGFISTAGTASISSASTAHLDSDHLSGLLEYRIYFASGGTTNSVSLQNGGNYTSTITVLELAN